jgi:hypothetical protein
MHDIITHTIILPTFSAKFVKPKYVNNMNASKILAYYTNGKSHGNS